MRKTDESGYNSPKGNHTGTDDLQLYNLEGLRKMADNDEVFMKQTLGIFVQNSDAAMQDLTGSLREKDWKRVGEIAHKILPSCRHLEVNSVIPRLVELKTRTLYDDNPTDVSRLVQETIFELGRVSESLKKEIGL
jgi:hypothetical protein